MVERYKKGKCVYTHWDRKSEQVTVFPKQRAGPSPEAAVELPEETAGGIAADAFVIHHRDGEFVIDAGRLARGGWRLRVVGRFVMSPAAAKRLAAAIELCLGKAQ